MDKCSGCTFVYFFRRTKIEDEKTTRQAKIQNAKCGLENVHSRLSTVDVLTYELIRNLKSEIFFYCLTIL